MDAKQSMQAMEQRQHGRQGAGSAKARSYSRLILDTYSSVMLLNSMELGVLEECLRVFRGGLFASDPRVARANTLE